MTGRQLARVSHVKSGETIWSGLYPGNSHTMNCLQPAVEAVESSLDLGLAQRRRTVWRTDGGAGSDALIGWLIDREYHVLMKGHSNRRAHALGQKVRRWDEWAGSWIGEVDPPTHFKRPVQFFVKKRLKNEVFHYSYYVSTIKLSSKRAFIKAYDLRGGAEVEQFRQDKSGLHLAKRRKSQFYGQYGLILLTDLAHNLLANFRHKGLTDSPFASFGHKRMVRDLLQISGYLTFANDKLIRIDLDKSNENSEALCICLKKYLLSE